MGYRCLRVAELFAVGKSWSKASRFVRFLLPCWAQEHECIDCHKREERR
jgi:hypothetical protein